MLPCEDFVKFDAYQPIKSVVETTVNLAFFCCFFFCNPTCSLRYFVSFLVIWTITLSGPLLYLAIVIKVEWSPLLTMI